MAEPHPFDGPAAAPCRHRDADGEPCGYLAGSDVHQLDRTEATVRRAVPLGARRNPSPRTGAERRAEARARRSAPWNELPVPSKAIVATLAVLGLVLAVCVTATVCRLILSAGGWFG